MTEIDLNGKAVAIVDKTDYGLVSDAGPWYLHPRGYAQSRGGVFMHRLILGLEPGSGITDHVNGNGLDNRRANLRVVSAGENARNKRRRTGNHQSRYMGVCRYRRGNLKPWQATIAHEGNQYHLGYYATEKAAALAYDAAARKYHGEFATLNFPQDGEMRAT